MSASNCSKPARDGKDPYLHCGTTVTIPVAILNAHLAHRLSRIDLLLLLFIGKGSLNTDVSLAEIVNAHEKHVSRRLKKLKALGLLSITYLDKQRRITPNYIGAVDNF